MNRERIQSIVVVLASLIMVASYVQGDEPEGQGETKEAPAKIKETRSGSWTPGLSEAEKRTLFAIAEDTLEWCVNGEKGELSFDKYKLTPKLREKTATFVTLKIGKDLRGCIGSLSPVAAMYKSVHDNAVSAALKDGRFSPVLPAELEKIDVYVSVLSPLKPIRTIDDFKVGEHGIVLEKWPNSAVFLPEVPIEQGWNKEQTMDSLCVKAGMREGEWRRGSRYRIFSSVVLSK